MAGEMCQKWCGLIGEELLLLSASSSSDSYIAASEARIKARARPTFHFRGAGKKTSGAYQQRPAFAYSATASADPKQHLQKENAATAAKPPAAIAKPKSAAKAKAHAPELSVGHPQRRQDASDAKPKASKLPAAQPVQHQDATKAKPKTPKLSAGPPPWRHDVPILPLPPLLPTPKRSQPTPPKTSNSNNSKSVLFVGSKPTKSQASAVPDGCSSSSEAFAASDVVDVDKPLDNGNAGTSEADWRVSADDDWDVNRVAMDSHGRIAGDLAMAQAKLCGSRRGRPASPSGSPNPPKFICIADEQPEEHKQQLAEPTVSQDLAVHEESQGSAAHQVSQDLAEPQPSARKVDYETWDLKRYQHAITIESRHRFWKFASEKAKEKLTKELLQLSPSASTRKQARTMGWILSSDGEATA